MKNNRIKREEKVRECTGRYKNGYDKGFDLGYDTGFKIGYNLGYERGFEDAQRSMLEKPFEWSWHRDKEWWEYPPTVITCGII